MCLLHLISEGNGYGYEMMKQLHGAFPDTKESAVYALIRGRRWATAQILQPHKKRGTKINRASCRMAKPSS